VRSALLICGLWLGLLFAVRGETLPPKPENYFNDYAGVVLANKAHQIDETLRQYERDSSNQIVVAIFKKMDSSSSVDDYTQRVAQSWKVGQKDRNNGAVLFVFTDTHKIFIQVGYGLEAVLPDITCSHIIENEIKPRFKTGDFAGGITFGVDAMIKATRGEYKGTGKVHGDDDGSFGAIVVVVIILLYVVICVVSWLRRGTTYTSNGRRSSSWGGGGFGMGGGSSGGGGFGGGDSGGGFSGGGGSFGGGGAGGSW